MTTAQQKLADSHQNSRLPVSVVIVNYNAGPVLTACVAAIVDEVEEVIIVDNASTDTSLATLTARFPAQSGIQLIHNTTNLGFAAACNIGYAASKAAYVLFLNPDCEVQERSLQRMLRVLEANPRIAMTGGYLLNPDGSEQGGGRRAMPTPWRAFLRATGLFRLGKVWPRFFADFHLHQQPLPDSPVEVEAVSGALMLVRRAALDDIGGWDADYFLHCEDLDLCMRLQQKNWQIVFVPDAPVIHHKGVCSKARPFFVAWHKHKGMMRFYRKFYSQRYTAAIMVLITAGVWSRFILAVVFHSLRILLKPFKPLKTRHG